MWIIPVRTLSRKPFVLMLQDDAGEIRPVRLDIDLANSSNALIVLDEYNDTCWAWIGRDVSMPTKMHALRIAKSIQKSGHRVGDTTIGMATSKIIEVIERDESDPEMAANIAAFRKALSRKWRYEDSVLAYDEEAASEKEPEAPHIRESAPRTETTHVRPETPVRHVSSATTAQPRSTTPSVPRATKTEAMPDVEKKMAFLLYSAVKNSDLVYTERFTRDGKMGIKIEAPGAMVIEATVEGSDVVVSPSNFGDSEQAKRVRTDYENWLARL
ncbi:MAG: hypothetical protein QXS20_09515 [Candidatus Thorarchaeota archaeon]